MTAQEVLAQLTDPEAMAQADEDFRAHQRYLESREDYDDRAEAEAAEREAE